MAPKGGGGGGGGGHGSSGGGGRGSGSRPKNTDDVVDAATSEATSITVSGALLQILLLPMAYYIFEQVGPKNVLNCLVDGSNHLMAAVMRILMRILRGTEGEDEEVELRGRKQVVLGKVDEGYEEPIDLEDAEKA
ncbi:MAG: hypothetical protein Q9179_006409 [Wetmoreana sp. 5 TL-2023]